MGNRADRRASAKIAKQAVKRAKTPLEGAILRAAAAFANEEIGGHLGPHLSDAGFDETWERLGEDLRAILDDLYDAFVVETFAEAGLGALEIEGADARPRLFATRLFLCPTVGTAERAAAFVGDAAEREGLAASLREFGLVPEAGRCRILPVLVPLSDFSPATSGPGAVRALHDRLAALAAAGGEGREAGEGDAAPASQATAESREGAPTGVVGAIAGLELAPMPDARAPMPSLEDEEAEALARIANAASWVDAYASAVPGLAIDVPLDWPACAAALAWETVAVSMERVRRQRGLVDGRPETLHCAPSDDGTGFVFSAIQAGRALGPFTAPADLAWLDIEEFFARAEASAEALVEHPDEGAVIAPLLAG